MKWAIILGASGDIGGETARKLAEDGWSIYLHYAHNYNRVEKLREELVATFPDQQFLLVQADFTQEAAADQLADQLFSIQAIVVANGHEDRRDEYTLARSRSKSDSLYRTDVGTNATT